MIRKPRTDNQLKKTIQIFCVIFLTAIFCGCKGRRIFSPAPRTIANDFNSDGIADILVGARDVGGGTTVGAAYVFYGSSGLSQTIATSAANLTLNGTNDEDWFGEAVTSGDVNDDGIADIIVGAPSCCGSGLSQGVVYIFYGTPSLPQTINAASANVIITGEAIDDRFGWALASSDVNGDQIADIIVGAWGDDTGGGGAGAAYVFYGSRALAATISASAANVKLIGENATDTFGASVATGDVNNNGIDDIIVGAYLENSGGADSGAAYVFYGSAALATSIDASLANVKLIGEVASDFFGFSVATGDVNNDGIADIIVGATGEDSGGALAGASYVFYGSTSLASSIDASLANVKLIGETGGDDFGISVTAGDINNDGIADIIAGADLEDAGGASAGASYIFYGSASLAQSIDASLASVKLIGENATNQFGYSVNSNGDVNNDGITDLFAGAGGVGVAYIFYGSASLAQSIDASLANIRITGDLNGAAGSI